MSSMQPFGDVLVVVGKYEKDGRERNRYAKIGTLFTSPHFSNVAIKIDTIPLDWGQGWLTVKVKEVSQHQDAEDPYTKTSGYEKAKVAAASLKKRSEIVKSVDEVFNDTEPINLDDLPF